MPYCQVWYPKVGYHVATEKLLQKYMETGYILPPVRFWGCFEKAKWWAQNRCGGNRTVIIEVEPNEAYPLPDHKPGYFSPHHVKVGKIIKVIPTNRSFK